MSLGVKISIIVVSILMAVVIASVVAYLIRKKSDPTAYTPYQNRKKRRYTRLNKLAKHGGAMLIGDSIIDFFELPIFFPNDHHNMFNRGISGDTSDKLILRLQDNALLVEPEKIFYLIGTNDIHKGFSDDNIIANIETLIDMAKNSNVDKIHVLSLFPVNNSVDNEMVANRTNERIRGINEKLVALCASKDVVYINVHDSLTDENGDLDRAYTVDGLHPNKDGYKIVTKIIKEYI